MPLTQDLVALRRGDLVGFETSEQSPLLWTCLEKDPSTFRSLSEAAKLERYDSDLEYTFYKENGKRVDARMWCALVRSQFHTVAELRVAPLPSAAQLPAVGADVSLDTTLGCAMALLLSDAFLRRWSIGYLAGPTITKRGACAPAGLIVPCIVSTCRLSSVCRGCSLLLPCEANRKSLITFV